MYFKREMVSGSLALHLNVTSELRHLTKPDIFHQLLGGGGSSWRPFSSWWIKMMRSSRKKNQRNAFLFGIHKSDNSQPLWKMGSGQKGWSQKSAYFSWPQDSGKALPNKPQPKKQHIAILLKKKSNCAEKTTTYGWVGCERKEYSYHIWTFPLQTWGKGTFSRRECGEVSKPLFWKHNWEWERQRRFCSRLGTTENQELNFTFDPRICWKKWKQTKAENPGFVQCF